METYLWFLLHIAVLYYKYADKKPFPPIIRTPKPFAPWPWKGGDIKTFQNFLQFKVLSPEIC